MQDERTVFFTTGQFAKLCRTTKETLFHYDSLGCSNLPAWGRTATGITAGWTSPPFCGQGLTTSTGFP